MLLPFWLALSASVVLHLGVLLAPGWGLPLEDEPEPALEAVLAPPPVAAKPAPAAPVKKRPPVARSSPPASPAQPKATMPAEPAPSADPAAATETNPAPAPAPESVPEAPPETAAPTLAVPPAPTFASQWPREGRILYQVTRGGEGFVIGQSEQRWTHDGQRYEIHAETETTGLAALFRPVKVIQDSHGVFDAAGLRPQSYAASRDGKSQGGARFDPEQGQISQDRGSGAAFVAGAQDLLSIFYQLAALPFDVPDFPLTVATGRKVATFVVTIGQEQSLATPLGMHRVRHLWVVGAAREDSIDLWLDVESRLPLKIRYRDRKGEIYDQIAIAIDTAAPPASAQ